ncbi:MAG: VacJ family lipoprotein [Alphaproteobacteria bacterium]|nr:VacJ family lipoprotein [Alphaproteobacteria bacterium]
MPPEVSAPVGAPTVSDHEVPASTASTVAAEPPLHATPAESTPPADLPNPAPDSATNPMDPNAIVVTARPPAPPGDPLQSVNAKSFETIQTVDKAIVGPAALTYKRTVPGEVRSGLRNFLNNLQEPVVFLNYLLQIKPGKAAETLGRFTVNSTIGVAGLVDVAKKRPFKLPRRPNGFAYTLGYYGVKPGPFLFLPVIGPTTVRDLFGRWVDLLVLPWAVGKPFDQPAYAISTVIVRGLDERAEYDERLRKVREESTDPYATMREAYLQNRQAEIDALHGRHSNAVNPAPGLANPAPPNATIFPDMSGQDL